MDLHLRLPNGLEFGEASPWVSGAYATPQSYLCHIHRRSILRSGRWRRPPRSVPVFFRGYSKLLGARQATPCHHRYPCSPQVE